ncbi:exonuclease domain-containing protein [Nocardioides pakistanensis]
MSTQSDTAAGPARQLEYLVLDFENTGLDPRTDAIVEVAVVGVDRNLDVLFEYDTPVLTSPEDIAKIEANDYLSDMHSGNGLLDALRDGTDLPSLAEVEQKILALMAEHPQPQQKPQLAGSGVGHHDHNFIKFQMPVLADALFYSTCDAGVMRRAYLKATGRLLTDIDQSKTHRAMDDVRCHIEELRSFFEMFRAYEAIRQAGVI